jgi:hypothetical protein
VAEETVSVALIAAAMSPRHSVYPEVVVTMRKDDEVDAEDRDAEGTAHGYHSMVDKAEEDHARERGAAEDKAQMAEGQDGGTLGLGEYHWTSEGVCRFLCGGQPSLHSVVVLPVKAFQGAKGLNPDEVEAVEEEGGNVLVHNKAACKRLGRRRMASL